MHLFILQFAVSFSLVGLFKYLEHRLKQETLKYSSSSGFNQIATLKERDLPPSHYLLNIDYFSELSENLIEGYFSNEFEAGGYKWRLVIYPKGDVDNGGKGYISAYLEVTDYSNNLPTGWEINAIFNFFVFDQLRDKYVCLQDARERRFHSMKTEWGVAKFIDQKTFKNPSNGFLLNDKCTFGAEVFTIRNTIKGERLKVLEKNDEFTCEFKWKFENVFSTKSDNKWLQSDFFLCGDCRWSILMNPNGFMSGEGSNIAVCLQLDASSLPSDTEFLVNYTFRLINQTKIEKDYESDGSSEFMSSNICDRATEEDSVSHIEHLISLIKFKDPKMGFLVDDTCVIEVKVGVLAIKGPIRPNVIRYEVDRYLN